MGERQWGSVPSVYGLKFLMWEEEVGVGPEVLLERSKADEALSRAI